MGVPGWVVDDCGCGVDAGAAGGRGGVWSCGVAEEGCDAYDAG